MSNITIETHTNRNRVCRAVLFDLDGVLVSSEAQKAAAHIATVLQFGGTATPTLQELYAEIIGLSHEATRDRYLQCAGVVPTPEILSAYRGVYKANYRSMLDQIKATPGAVALVQALAQRGYPLGVVTSARAGEVTTILGRSGLSGYFATIVSAELVQKPKPAPEPYLKALALLGLTHVAHHVIAFEDSAAGIAAARAASLRVFAVRHALNQKQRFDEAERIFASLADAQILTAIEGAA